MEFKWFRLHLISLLPCYSHLSAPILKENLFTCHCLDIVPEVHRWCSGGQQLQSKRGWYSFADERWPHLHVCTKPLRKEGRSVSDEKLINIVMIHFCPRAKTKVRFELFWSDLEILQEIRQPKCLQPDRSAYFLSFSPSVYVTLSDSTLVPSTRMSTSYKRKSRVKTRDPSYRWRDIETSIIQVSVTEIKWENRWRTVPYR